MVERAHALSSACAVRSAPVQHKANLHGGAQVVGAPHDLLGALHTNSFGDCCAACSRSEPCRSFAYNHKKRWQLWDNNCRLFGSGGRLQPGRRGWKAGRRPMVARMCAGCAAHPLLRKMRTLARVRSCFG